MPGFSSHDDIHQDKLGWSQAKDPGTLHKWREGLESIAQFYKMNGFDANNHDSEILRAFHHCEEHCQWWNLYPISLYLMWHLTTPVFQVWFSIAFHPA